jgi:hypothetical protein
MQTILLYLKYAHDVRYVSYVLLRNYILCPPKYNFACSFARI